MEGVVECAACARAVGYVAQYSMTLWSVCMCAQGVHGVHGVQGVYGVRGCVGSVSLALPFLPSGSHGSLRLLVCIGLPCDTRLPAMRRVGYIVCGV